MSEIKVYEARPEDPYVLNGWLVLPETEAWWPKMVKVDLVEYVLFQPGGYDEYTGTELDDETHIYAAGQDQVVVTDGSHYELIRELLTVIAP